MMTDHHDESLLDVIEAINVSINQTAECRRKEVPILAALRGKYEADVKILNNMEYRNNFQTDLKGFEHADEKLKETLDFVEKKKHVLLNHKKSLLPLTTGTNKSAKKNIFRLSLATHGDSLNGSMPLHPVLSNRKAVAAVGEIVTQTEVLDKTNQDDNESSPGRSKIPKRRQNRSIVRTTSPVKIAKR